MAKWIALLGLVGLLGLIWLRYPDNHGAGPMVFRWVFGVILLASMGCWIWTAKLPVPALGLAVLGLLAVWFVNWRNIMVNYDEWVVRGMPEWGATSHPIPSNSTVDR